MTDKRKQELLSEAAEAERIFELEKKAREANDKRFGEMIAKFEVQVNDFIEATKAAKGLAVSVRAKRKLQSDEELANIIKEEIGRVRSSYEKAGKIFTFGKLRWLLSVEERFFINFKMD